MRIVNERVAGLDVHKKSVVAAIIVPRVDGSWHQAKRTFGTMTVDLLALSDWLLGQGVTGVAMESTGEYWKPIFNVLEETFRVILVNPQHLSRVPGRKTDQSDAEWIAELLQYGLLKPSFIPPPGQRELRELTRARTSFVRERSNLVNRLQKVLESANIKLGSVAADIMGISSRAMLAALIEAKATPQEMADLAKGRMREKREALAKALEGRVKPHHRFAGRDRIVMPDR
jgi:transposase